MILTLTQQKAAAFAPIPFAVLSCFSSSYVIYYLLRKEKGRQLQKQKQKLKRMYHRLVLAMNFAMVLASSTYVWGPFAVPKGTPNVYGASGTIQTCTANGFIFVMGTLAVPTYYGSLSLQAFMGIQNRFKEEKYRWIENFIHIIAWSFPLAISIAATATENFNPSISGCMLSKAPLGCEEADSNVPCQRGKDVEYPSFIAGFSLCFLYFVFPPSILIMMYCWIKRVNQKLKGSVGMQQIREQAWSQMIKQVAVQMSVYLVSFWCTWVPGFALHIHKMVTGEMILHELFVFTNCLEALQGFVLAGVYFTLERLGTQNVEVLPMSESKRRRERTVIDIRADAAREPLPDSEPFGNSSRRLSFGFNIFDGTPDPASPWAMFINEDND